MGCNCGPINNNFSAKSHKEIHLRRKSSEFFSSSETISALVSKDLPKPIDKIQSSYFPNCEETTPIMNKSSFMNNNKIKSIATHSKSHFVDKHSNNRWENWKLALKIEEIYVPNIYSSLLSRKQKTKHLQVIHEDITRTFRSYKYNTDSLENILVAYSLYNESRMNMKGS